jgi:hypothetical protein
MQLYTSQPAGKGKGRVATMGGKLFDFNEFPFDEEKQTLGIVF